MSEASSSSWFHVRIYCCCCCCLGRSKRKRLIYLSFVCHRYAYGGGWRPWMDCATDLWIFDGSALLSRILQWPSAATNTTSESSRDESSSSSTEISCFPGGPRLPSLFGSGPLMTLGEPEDEERESEDGLCSFGKNNPLLNLLLFRTKKTSTTRSSSSSQTHYVALLSASSSLTST
jgi:hypothetical protein